LYNNATNYNADQQYQNVANVFYQILKKFRMEATVAVLHLKTLVIKCNILTNKWLPKFDILIDIVKSTLLQLYYFRQILFFIYKMGSKITRLYLKF